MRPSFYTRLVNGPFEDPCLFVSFAFEKRAFLFDLGEIHKLSAKDLLKVSHVFVSHTHIDHFIGFDRLLRIVIGRDKTIKFFGPPGFIANVEGKLNSYTWNLIKDHSLILDVTEIHPTVIKNKIFSCKKGLLPGIDQPDKPFDRQIVKAQRFSIITDFLDHKISSLGFRMEERFHINMIKDRMDALNLAPGPWINRFKQAIFENQDYNTPFCVTSKQHFTLGELAEKIACISPGQKIAYITDVVYNDETRERMIKLAKDVNILFIESAFRHEDKAMAAQKYHLTTFQAGRIAREAKVDSIQVFHFSTRYMHAGHILYNEAKDAFKEQTRDS
jgi:ribonuclease Z